MTRVRDPFSVYHVLQERSRLPQVKDRIANNYHTSDNDSSRLKFFDEERNPKCNWTNILDKELAISSVDFTKKFKPLISLLNRQDEANSATCAQLRAVVDVRSMPFIERPSLSSESKKLSEKLQNSTPFRTNKKDSHFNLLLGIVVAEVVNRKTPSDWSYLLMCDLKEDRCKTMNEQGVNP